MGREVHLQQMEKPWNGLVRLAEVAAKPTGSEPEWVIVDGLSDYSQTITDVIGSILTVEKDSYRETREITIISGTRNLIGRLLKPVTT
jgi:cytochrome bd-type quinol oxidase subunit 1